MAEESLLGDRAAADRPSREAVAELAASQRDQAPRTVERARRAHGESLEPDGAAAPQANGYSLGFGWVLMPM
jgi:hypothetical protein